MPSNSEMTVSQVLPFLKGFNKFLEGIKDLMIPLKGRYYYASDMHGFYSISYKTLSSSLKREN